MDIEQARTFLEIVRCGSLVAAAERLFVSQTAITARVQRLEQQLGCQLFVRSRNGASLTSDGEAFVSYANQLVQTWEAARRDLPLHGLNCRGTQVKDLGPLRQTPLKLLWCDLVWGRDVRVLKSIDTLEKVNDAPAAALLDYRPSRARE